MSINERVTLHAVLLYADEVSSLEACRQVHPNDIKIRKAV